MAEEEWENFVGLVVGAAARAEEKSYHGTTGIPYCQLRKEKLGRNDLSLFFDSRVFLPSERFHGGLDGEEEEDGEDRREDHVQSPVFGGDGEDVVDGVEGGEEPQALHVFLHDGWVGLEGEPAFLFSLGW